MKTKNDIPRASEIPACHNVEEPVWCVHCCDWRFPDENWKCTGKCGHYCFYGYGKGFCDKCGNRCNGLRFGHEWKKLCLCHVTPEHMAKWRREMSRHEARMQLEDQKAKWGKTKKAAANPAATACWDDHDHECEVTFASPRFEFCRNCPKFGAPRAQFGFEPPSNIEMEEVDIL